jgi:DNA repair ATPase RecN
MDNPLKELETEVNSLQKDMAQIGVLVDRLDITIEKLTEVSTTVSRLLAVQENRLENQEKISDKIQASLENHRTETNKTVKEIYDKIQDVETDLLKDMDSNQDKVIKKIEELKSEANVQHQEMSDRMSRLEKWMWILVGGGIVLGVIAQNMNFGNLF